MLLTTIYKQSIKTTILFFDAKKEAKSYCV